MGYAIHILRENPRLTLQEWLSYVRSDLEMTYAGPVLVRRNPATGEEIRVEAPGYAVWRSPATGEDIGFDFSELGARVSVGNADNAAVAKMVQIAMALGARVEGDEGESYGAGES